MTRYTEKCEDCGRSIALADPCKRIHWPRRGEGPYLMCDMCSWHSIKNRGAEEYTEEAPK